MVASTPRTALLFAAAAFAALAGVNAQSSIPVVSVIPKACSAACGSTIEPMVLCTQEYGSSTSTSETDAVNVNVAACLCNALPSSSEISTCSTCLNDNNAAAIGSALSQASQVCTIALTTCAFPCDFPTCASSDINCQCSDTYLQNILNCASCNTANNNTEATLIGDYNALKDSCVNQNYTQIPSATQALPSPTGQAGYIAPTLTGTGGGAAATGAVTGSAAASGGLMVSNDRASTTLPVSAATAKTIATSAAASAAASGSARSSATSASSASAAASSGVSAAMSSLSVVSAGTIAALFVGVVGGVALL